MFERVTVMEQRLGNEVTAVFQGPTREAVEAEADRWADRYGYAYDPIMVASLEVQTMGSRGLERGWRTTMKRLASCD